MARRAGARAARGGEDVETAAAGAAQLYALLAADVDQLLDDQQREVVQHALASAGHDEN